MDIVICTSTPSAVDLGEIRKAIEDLGYLVLTVSFDE